VRGIRGVVHGTLQLAMASADLSAEERKQAAKRGIELAAHVLGHDAIVPIVHPANPVHGLTVEELRGIFSGEFANWKEVGGPDLAITVLSDDPQSGTAEAWHTLVLHSETLTPKAVILDAGPLRRKVAELPGAIGYVAHTFLDPGVKGLAVEGVAVGSQAIRDGRYPLRRAFSLVSTASPPATAQEFIDYMRHPAKGQAILAAAGNIPLT
jgi:phosphate transport system substrate-binding protein